MCIYATSGPTLDATLVVNKWLSDGVAQEVLLALVVACHITVPVMVVEESCVGC